MRLVLRFGICLLVVFAAGVVLAEAQPTGSSLRGYVKDDQGGVLPGVTVTATSPNMITAATGVSPHSGSGAPTTATMSTPECCAITRSISAG